MAEARALKFFFTKGDYIISLAKRMTNHPKKGRGFAHVTNFCLHNCGLRKNFATARWDQ